MKTILVGILLAVVAMPSSAAYWMKLGSNQSGDLYGDVGSLRMNGNLASLWFRVDYKAMKAVEVNGVKKLFNQEKILYVANCMSGKGAIKSLVQYNSINEEMIQNIDNSSVALEQPVPDSVGENLYDQVCDSVRAVRKVQAHQEASDKPSPQIVRNRGN